MKIKLIEFILIFVIRGQEENITKKGLHIQDSLKKYKEFLTKGGEIYFKTDDDNLFLDSLNYFEEAGFEVVKKTFDLHEEVDFWENIETEHEKMFSEQGIKIKALVARLN